VRFTNLRRTTAATSTATNSPQPAPALWLSFLLQITLESIQYHPASSAELALSQTALNKLFHQLPNLRCTATPMPYRITCSSLIPNFIYQPRATTGALLRRLRFTGTSWWRFGAGEERVAASGDESWDAEEERCGARRSEGVQRVAATAGQGAREDLQRLRAMLDVQVGKLDVAAQRAAEENEQADC